MRAIRSSVFSSSNSASEASATAQASGLAVKECPWGSARSKLSPTKASKMASRATVTAIGM